MAMNQKKQMVVIAIGVIVAGYMGYTTLFPNTTSKYAEQNVQSVVLEPAESHQEVATVPAQPELMAPPSQELTTPELETVLAGAPAALVNKINLFLDAPTERVEPFQLTLGSDSLLAQSKEITDATMAAKLREQQQKHISASMTQLGIDAPRAQVSAVHSMPSKASSYPVSLFRIGDGPTTARIQYRGQWLEVHPGMALGDMTVIRITSKGVTIREDGQTRLLTPRDS